MRKSPRVRPVTIAPAESRKGENQVKLKLLKMFFIVFTLCAATAIPSSAQTFTTRVHFNGTNGGQSDSSVVQGRDGNFYGTTSAGGATSGAFCPGDGGCGTVFRMTAAGKVTTLYNFCAQTNCTDGADPQQLLLASDGNFYGITATGGANCLDLDVIGCGTVFKITVAGALTTLYSFCAQANCADGWNPDALLQAPDGNFYGATFHGGLKGAGEIFELTPGGVLTVVHNFCSLGGGCVDGGLPESLMQASDGNFYGTTLQGGTGNVQCGVVFQLTTAGVLTTLHDFTADEGCSGHSGVIQGSDGNFYGTSTEGGGPHRRGTVYKMTPGGELTRLYGFCAQTNCADGEIPEGGLVQGTDGNFYGTTRGNTSGTDKNSGTVFEITPTGTLTTLHSFDFHDGEFPEAALVQATSGTFYGTTSIGGILNCSEGCGTVYSLSMGLGPFVEANPNAGNAGRVVNILGNNLTGATSVTFHGVAAAYTVVSGTYIRAVVPSGASTGTIEVTTPSGTLSSNIEFVVWP